MSYKQLTHIQRYQIKALLKTRHSKTEIAEVIEVHRATIYWELKRNNGNEAWASPSLVDTKNVQIYIAKPRRAEVA